MSINASTWKEDIHLALNVIESMFAINLSSTKCYNTIQNLCGDYLSGATASEIAETDPTEESPHTQINNVYSMMWPNAEADVVMRDDAWLTFLGDFPPEEQTNFDNSMPEIWGFDVS